MQQQAAAAGGGRRAAEAAAAATTTSTTQTTKQQQACDRGSQVSRRVFFLLFSRYRRASLANTNEAATRRKEGTKGTPHRHTHRV